MIVAEYELDGSTPAFDFWLVEQVPPEGVVLADALFMLFYGDCAVESPLLVTADHGGVMVFYFYRAEGKFIHAEVLVFRGASDDSEAGAGNDEKSFRKSF